MSHAQSVEAGPALLLFSKFSLVEPRRRTISENVSVFGGWPATIFRGRSSRRAGHPRVKRSERTCTAHHRSLKMSHSEATSRYPPSGVEAMPAVDRLLCVPPSKSQKAAHRKRAPRRPGRAGPPESPLPAAVGPRTSCHDTCLPRVISGSSFSPFPNFLSSEPKSAP
jgi:hypothetical protein